MQNYLFRLAPIVLLAASAWAQTVVTVDLHLVQDPSPRPLPAGTSLELAVGDKLTLLANARDASGQSVLDWEPVWPTAKTGFMIEARGTWAELTATAEGSYTMVVRAAESGAVTYLDLSFWSNNAADQGHAAAASSPSYPVQDQLLLMLDAGNESRILDEGERLTCSPGSEYRLQVRVAAVSQDTGESYAAEPAAAFRPRWSMSGSPSADGLHLTAMGTTALLRSLARGVYTVRVSDEQNPAVTTAIEVVVLADPHEGPALTVSVTTGPQTPPAYRSEVHRICANLDIHYRELLSGYEHRNNAGMRTASRELVRWGKLLEREEPDGVITHWDADGLVEEAEDILEEISEGDGNKVRGNLTDMREDCTSCHGFQGRSAYIPPAVPSKD